MSSDQSEKSKASQAGGRCAGILEMGRSKPFIRVKIVEYMKCARNRRCWLWNYIAGCSELEKQGEINIEIFTWIDGEFVQVIL